MRSFELSDEDADQVKSVLLAFAEMSDQHTIQSEILLGRARGRDKIEDLKDQVKDFNDDTLNLKRIAKIFE